MKKSILLVLSLSFSLNIIAQASIKGTVSSDSLPLPYASIVIKNTASGVVTDENGNFELKVNKGDTLSVSYIGLETKEIVVGDFEQLNVALKGSYVLDEVVVIGYKTYTRISCRCRCYGVCIEHIEREQIKEKETQCFPNPSPSGVFKLRLANTFNRAEIAVYNFSGQLVQKKLYRGSREIINIDLSRFSSGIYIVNVITDGTHSESMKLIRS